eukprot:scpid49039/ scgid34769/ 
MYVLAGDRVHVEMLVTVLLVVLTLHVWGSEGRLGRLHFSEMEKFSRSQLHRAGSSANRRNTDWSAGARRFRKLGAGASPAVWKKNAAAAGDVMLLGLPVGQGDATLIVCPEHDGNVIVFDMGSTQQAWTPGRVRDYLQTSTLNGVRPLMERVSTIIVSHPHTDHYNYIPDVFPQTPARGRGSRARGGGGRDHNMPARFNRRRRAAYKAFVAGSIADYKYSGMSEWLTAVGAQTFNNGNSCFLDSCRAGNSWNEKLCGASSPVSFKVIAANMGSGTNVNEKSVVLKIILGTQTALLVGDFEDESQAELVNRVNNEAPGLLVSNIYKVSHHGASRLANYPAFLQAISANHAFISSAYATVSAYGHPKCETLDRLLAVGTLLATPTHEVDCTDANRNLVRRQLQSSIFSTTPTANQICVVEFSMPPSGTISPPRLVCEGFRLSQYRDLLRRSMSPRQRHLAMKAVRKWRNRKRPPPGVRPGKPFNRLITG